MKRRGVLVLVGIALALCGRALAEFPVVVELHRGRVFPFLNPPLQALAGLTNGSLGEVVVGSLAVGVLFLLIRTRGRFLGPVALAGGFAVLAFYLLWGVAYSFPPLEGRMANRGGGDIGRGGERGRRDGLVALAEWVVGLAGRSVTPPTDRGPAARLQEINEALNRGFRRLPPALDAASVGGMSFGPVKVSRFSFALSRLQLSGYYFPWTGEALINGEMPPSLWPRVAAHELSHQRGFARENEATVIGVLACLASGDPAVVYSGALGLFASLDRDLARADPEERRRLWALLPPRALSDLEAESSFWKKHEGTAGVVSEKINDAYLKAQGVRSGVASYSETTSLFLLAAERGIVPNL